MAEHIPGAKYVELPGEDHLPFVGDQDAILDEVEEFLTGVRQTQERDTVLATVLSTQIVDSKEHAERLGNDSWYALLDRLREQVRKEIEWFRGREIDMVGDRPLAIFDGPARAIRCAWLSLSLLRAWVSRCVWDYTRANVRWLAPRRRESWRHRSAHRRPGGKRRGRPRGFGFQHR